MREIRSRLGRTAARLTRPIRERKQGSRLAVQSNKIEHSISYPMKVCVSASDILEAIRLQQCRYRLAIELWGQQQILDIQCSHSL